MLRLPILSSHVVGTPKTRKASMHVVKYHVQLNLQLSRNVLMDGCDVVDDLNAPTNAHASAACIRHVCPVSTQISDHSMVLRVFYWDHRLVPCVSHLIRRRLLHFSCKGILTAVAGTDRSQPCWAALIGAAPADAISLLHLLGLVSGCSGTTLCRYSPVACTPIGYQAVLASFTPQVASPSMLPVAPPRFDSTRNRLLCGGARLMRNENC